MDELVCQILEVTPEQLAPNLRLRDIDAFDEVNQADLLTAIERQLELTFELDDYDATSELTATIQTLYDLVANRLGFDDDQLDDSHFLQEVYDFVAGLLGHQIEPIRP